MAVNFEPEDGSGKSNATSYLSVAEADQLVEDFGLSWSASPSKEVALNNATQYLDSKYGAAYPGSRRVSTQALYFPRDGVYIDDILLGYDEIPKQLQQATVQAAVYFDNNSSLYPSADSEGSLKRKKIKVDVIEIEKEWVSSDAGAEIYDKIASLIGEITGAGSPTTTGGNFELERG